MEGFHLDDLSPLKSLLRDFHWWVFHWIQYSGIIGEENFWFLVVFRFFDTNFGFLVKFCWWVNENFGGNL